MEANTVIALRIVIFLGYLVAACGLIAGNLEKLPIRVQAYLWFIDIRKSKKDLNVFRIAWIGIVVSLFTTIIQFQKEHLDAESSKQQSQEEMEIYSNTLVQEKYQVQMASNALSEATDSLHELRSQNQQLQMQNDYLNQILGEFKTLTIEADFELQSYDTASFPFTDRMTELINPVKSDVITNGVEKIAMVANVYIYEVIGRIDRTERHRLVQQLSRPVAIEKVWGESIFEAGAGGVNSPPVLNPAAFNLRDTSRPFNVIATRQYFKHFVPSGCGVSVPYDELFTSNWLSQASGCLGFTNLFDYFHHPKLSAYFFSKDTIPRDEENADLVASPSPDLVAKPQFGYDWDYDGTIVHWIISYPARDWKQTVRLSTVHDLDRAALYFRLADVPLGEAGFIKPLSMVLHFDQTTINITNFETVSNNALFTARDEYSTSYFKVTLPPATYLPVGQSYMH